MGYRGDEMISTLETWKPESSLLKQSRKTGKNFAE